MRVWKPGLLCYKMQRKLIIKFLMAVGFVLLGTYCITWKDTRLLGRFTVPLKGHAAITQVGGQLNLHTPYHHLTSNSNTHLRPNEMKNIYVRNESSCKQTGMKFLVFECSSRKCGGWADRQKGIVTGFLLALLTNRYFAVTITRPCDFGKFLEPAFYNWRLCQSYIDSIMTPSNTQIHTDTGNLTHFDFEKQWNKRIVILHSRVVRIDDIRFLKNARKRIPWMMDKTNPEIIKMILNTLFTPGLRMVNELKAFTTGVTHNGRRRLICTHIRTKRNPTISKTNNAIFTFLERYNDVEKNVIYVATDSDELRESAANTFANFVNINRKIVHVDLFKDKDNTTELCEGLYTALFEQYMLTQCDVLVITRSNFGAMAGYIRGVSKGLYLYLTQEDAVITTNLTNIQSVYRFDCND